MKVAWFLLNAVWAHVLFGWPTFGATLFWTMFTLPTHEQTLWPSQPAIFYEDSICGCEKLSKFCRIIFNRSTALLSLSSTRKSGKFPYFQGQFAQPRTNTNLFSLFFLVNSVFSVNNAVAHFVNTLAEIWEIERVVVTEIQETIKNLFFSFLVRKVDRNTLRKRKERNRKSN